MAGLLDWLQATGVATAVRDSVILTATLSAVHLLGFTLATGGAFVSNMRLLGMVLRDRSVLEVSRPATRGVALGLLISVVTGVPLFAPRALAASANPVFQAKMALLAAAAAFQFVVHPWAAHHAPLSRTQSITAGAIGSLLWGGLALAGCGFILLE